MIRAAPNQTYPFVFCIKQPCHPEQSARSFSSPSWPEQLPSNPLVLPSLPLIAQYPSVVFQSAATRDFSLTKGQSALNSFGHKREESGAQKKPDIHINELQQTAQYQF